MIMEQRTDEWFAARLGKVTASRVADLIATTKSGYSASRANYMAELICERLSNTKADGFTSSAMTWGVETEPLARAAYQSCTGELVEAAGFVQHPTILMAGASPDGLVDVDGLIEIKCPNTATHIETLLADKAPTKYFAQMQWQMACTGRKWCDFVSFDPRLPDKFALFVTRIEIDSAFIEATEKEVVKFLKELDEKLEALNAKVG